MQRACFLSKIVFAVLPQEMASQGLSVIYQLGDAEAREKLLSSLMGTLQGAHTCPRLLDDLLARSGEVMFCAPSRDYIVIYCAL